MSLESEIGKRVLEKLKGVIPNDANLNETLRLLAKWRSVLIQEALIENQGTLVMQGPLKGMSFLKHSAEGCHIAKILGTYEQPLQPYLNKAIVGTYDQIVNIGCAEGYYAVGMAQKMQNTHVTAFDLNPKAQEVCLKLASQGVRRIRVRFDAGGGYHSTACDNLKRDADLARVVTLTVQEIHNNGTAKNQDKYADTVTETYWKPVMEEITRPREVAPLRLAA